MATDTQGVSFSELSSSFSTPFRNTTVTYDDMRENTNNSSMFIQSLYLTPRMDFQLEDNLENPIINDSLGTSHDVSDNSSFPLSISTSATSSFDIRLLSGNTSQTLWEQNEIYARHMIPVMVFIALLMIVGFHGNCLVVYVYGFKFKSTTQNVLIVTLGCLDLVTCLFAMPMEIADVRFHHTFSSEIACQILRFLTVYITVASSFTLTCVAFDRHRRITSPLSQQMTTGTAKKWTALNLVISICFAWPTYVMSGIRSSETGIAGLTGRDCSYKDEYDGTIYPLILNAFFVCVFLINIAVLSVFYFRIWKAAKNRNMSRIKKCSSTITFSTDSSRSDRKSDTVLQQDTLRSPRKHPSLKSTDKLSGNLARFKTSKEWESSKLNVSSNGATLLTDFSLCSNLAEEGVVLSLNSNVMVNKLNAKEEDKYQMEEFKGTPSSKTRNTMIECNNVSDNVEKDTNRNNNTGIQMRKDLEAVELTNTFQDFSKSNASLIDQGVKKSSRLHATLPSTTLTLSPYFAPLNLLRKIPSWPSLPIVSTIRRSSNNVNALNFNFSSFYRLGINDKDINETEVDPDTSDIENLNKSSTGAFSFPDTLDKLDLIHLQDFSNTDKNDLSRMHLLSQKRALSCEEHEPNHFDVSVIEITNRASCHVSSITAETRQDHCTIVGEQSKQIDDNDVKKHRCDVDLHDYFKAEEVNDVDENTDDQRVTGDVKIEKASLHLIDPLRKTINFPPDIEENGSELFSPSQSVHQSIDIEETYQDDDEGHDIDKRLHTNPHTLQCSQIARETTEIDPNIEKTISTMNILDNKSLKSKRSVFMTSSLVSLHPSNKKSTQKEDLYRSPKGTSSTDLVSSTSTPNRRHSWFCSNLDKTTVIALAVTCVFVFSFLPYLALMAVRGLNKSFYENLDWTSLCIYDIFTRFYFLNSASNPLLYGLFNTNFRHECLSIWRHVIGLFYSKVKAPSV